MLMAAVAAVSNSAYDLAGFSRGDRWDTGHRRSRAGAAQVTGFLLVQPGSERRAEPEIRNLVVCPSDEAEIIRVARAAARFRVPITPRGGGTGNYGQAVPLAGGIVLDMTGLDAIEWARPGQIRVQAAHPDVGINSLADMKGKPIAISRQTIDTWWRFLADKYGFSDTQIRPYSSQIGPFLVDKNLIQQGYVTSEPFAIETEGHFTPKVFLLADDAGYKSYATVIETTRKLVQTKPDLVQRMVDATIEGWYSYLYGDPFPANTLIKRENPEIFDAQIAYSYGKMKEYGIIDSGGAKTLGIGAMTDARWQTFYESAAAVGLYPKGLDYKQAYTLQFVDKKHGMEAAK
jgi:ABC-type nitrate/sulfonate/bicarbonate transport system substrate-binding protein